MPAHRYPTPRHRCATEGCTFIGQFTTDSCRCHKTTEQMLIEQRDEALELLREARERMVGISPSMKRLIARTDAAITKMERA